MVKLKNIYNKIFNKKTENVLELNCSKSSGRTSIVYIVGPPAVGKSTFIDHLINDGKFLKRKIPKKKAKVDNEVSLYLINKKISNGLDDFDRLKTRMNKIERDFFLMNESQKNNSTYLEDEGLVHHFHKELIAMYYEEKKMFTKFFNRRRVIFLKSNPKKILNRAIKRKNETGKFVKFHLDKTEEEIIKQTHYRIERFEQLCELIKKCNGTSQMVNIDEGYEDISVV